MKILIVNTLAEARTAAGTLVDFRAPHHSVTPGALLREYCVASGGVLYVEELDQFSPEALAELAAMVHTSARYPNTAAPLGVILNLTLPEDADDETRRRIANYAMDLDEMANPKS